VVPTPTARDLHAVRGSGPKNIWAVGKAGTVLRYAGGGWDPVPASIDEDLLDLWTGGADDLLVVGEKGRALRRSGADWIQVAKLAGYLDAVSGQAPTYSSVSGAASSDLWVTPSRGLRTNAGGSLEVAVHWDGSDWTPRERPDCGGCVTTRAFAVAASEVWLIRSGGGPQRWDGASWTDVALPGVAPASFFGLWASATSVWLVGDGKADASSVIVERQGTSWRAHDDRIARDHRGRGVWGHGSEVWIVCLGGAILRYDGERWSVERSAGKSLLSVWGSSPSDIWAVGVAGTILHRAAER
jgi:hypothetical protein